MFFFPRRNHGISSVVKMFVSEPIDSLSALYLVLLCSGVAPFQVDTSDSLSRRIQMDEGRGFRFDDGVSIRATVLTRLLQLSRRWRYGKSYAPININQYSITNTAAIDIRRIQNC